MEPNSSAERQRRISELIRERVKEEEELADLETFIEQLPNTDQVRKSGSSSRSRRREDAADALSREQMLQGLQDKRARKMENIELLWKKIHALQDEERAQE